MKYLPVRVSIILMAVSAIGLVLGVLPRKNKVSAQIVPCVFSVTPSSVIPGSTTTFTVTVINNDEAENITYVRIRRPANDLFMFIGHAISGWDVHLEEMQLVINQNNITPLETYQMVFTATAANQEASAGDWRVEVSAEGGGDNAVSCSGDSISTAIVNPPPSNAPAISSIQISDISSDGVKVTWNTNEDATSIVEYGKTSALGQNSTVASYTRSHDVGLGSLSENTQYYYRIKSVDSEGNTAETATQTFTTAKAGTSGSVRVTPTPTPVPDTTGPILNMNIPTEQVYKEAPEITGSASDAGNITAVQYSVDGGKVWKAATKLTGGGTQAVTYTIKPENLTSGVYRLFVRATDTAKNTTRSKEFQFVIDQTPPAFSLKSDVSKPFFKAPVLTGGATDQYGVTSIDYSLDNGTNWLSVFTTQPPGITTASFTTTPLVSEDGLYTVIFRTSDRFGNSALSAPVQFIIDRIPPQIGGTVVRAGSSVILPGTDGWLPAVTQVPLTFIVSAIGGTTDIVLSHVSASGETDTEPVPMSAFGEDGLWQAPITFNQPGEYVIHAKAIDAVQNITERDIARVKVWASGTVMAAGQPVSGARVTVFWKKPESNGFIPWQGQSYGQENPITTDAEGKYSVLVPPGTYYVKAEVPEYRPTVSSIVTVSVPTPLHADLTVIPKRTFALGPWVFSWFDFGQTAQALVLPTDSPTETPEVLGELPAFSFGQGEKTVTDRSLRGKRVVLTFLNTWLPQSADQLQLFAAEQTPLGVEHVIIVPHETQSRVDVFRNRGGYTVPMWADRDGITVPVFTYGVFPMHIVVSPEGTVLRRAYGVLPIDKLVAQEDQTMYTRIE